MQCKQLIKKNFLPFYHNKAIIKDILDQLFENITDENDGFVQTVQHIEDDLTDYVLLEDCVGGVIQKVSVSRCLDQQK